jgi:nucleotide-binding universal stress UspA family protein
MYNKILVPLDGSEFAEAALPHVRALAECTGAEIILLRVVTQPMHAYVAPDPILYKSVLPDTVAECGVYLDRVASGMKAEGFKVTTETSTGPAAETILEFAQEMHADLIAMSTHGRSGLARWFIGSTADKVVRAATLPVLLARPLTLNMIQPSKEGQR